jgi:hypothetical protein
VHKTNTVRYNVIERLVYAVNQLIFTGHPLSQDGIIAIASSISVFVVTSILFSIFGCFCGLHCRKLRQNHPSSTNQQTPAIIYEDVLPKDYEQKFELQPNTAYAAVH